MKKHLPLLAAAVLATMAQTSYAAVLFQDNFDSLSTGGLNGQNGYAALGGTTVQAGGLSYSSGGVAAPGGTQKVNITGIPTANSWTLSNSFAGQSGTVYFSFATTWTGQDQDDLLYFALSDAVDIATPLSQSAGVRVNPNGVSGAFGGINASIRDVNSGSTTTTASGVVAGASTSSTQFIVGSLSKVSSTNYNTLKLWVNPTSTTEGAANVTVTRDMGIASGLGTFYFFTGATNEGTDTIQLDNITIATSYAEVVPAPPNNSVITASAVGSLGTAFVGAGNLTANSTLTKTGSDATRYSLVNATGDVVIVASGDGSLSTSNPDTEVITVGISKATAGAKSGSLQVDNTASTGASGTGSTDPNDTVNVSATIYDHSNASFAADADANSLTINFGIFTQGSGTQTAGFDIHNLLATAGYTADLDLDLVVSSGDDTVFTTNLAAFANLDAESFASFLASFDTDTIGLFSAVFTITLSDQNGIDDANANTQVLLLNLNGEVVTAAIPEPASVGLLALGAFGLMARRKR